MPSDILVFFNFKTMKHIFKALLIQGVLYSATLFFNFGASAQSRIFPELEGSWILDSVQVKEAMPDSFIQKTVLAGEACKFNDYWMLKLTLNSDNKASYTEAKERTISDVPYNIKDKAGNNATLIIDGVPDYKILNIQLIPDNILIINHSFRTGYNFQDIDISWKMYYHRFNQ